MIACAESAVRMIHVLSHPYIRALSCLAEFRNKVKRQQQAIIKSIFVILTSIIFSFYNVNPISIHGEYFYQVMLFNIDYNSWFWPQTRTALETAWLPLTIQHMFTIEFHAFYLTQTGFCNNFINFQPMTTYYHSF